MGDIFLENIQNFDQFIDELDFIFPYQNCALNEQVKSGTYQESALEHLPILVCIMSHIL